MTQHRTPLELIDLYWNEVWNNRNVELIREICADPIQRHDPDSTTTLSVDDQVARVRQQSNATEPFFEHEVLHADDRFVTSVWNMRSRKNPARTLCGIEVFESKDGKFIRCWNSAYIPGRWGREGDKSVRDDLPPPELIESRHQINAGWMQKVLKHAGLELPRLTHATPEPIGHGNTSSTLRCRLGYNANADKAIRSVICKLPRPGYGRFANPEQSFYRREAEAYRLLTSVARKHVPRAYLAASSDDGSIINLVLDDLSQTCRPGDQARGCSIAEAGAVIDAFADVHCAFWQDSSINQLPWLLDRPSMNMSQAYADRMGAARARFEGKIDPAYLDLVDHFAPLIDMAKENIVGRTLIHGEPRVDNVMFEDRSDGPFAWLIDWQFVDFGSPMYDTAYFLAGSLETEDRRACERDLIAKHQQAIASVDPTYTEDVAVQEYANSLPFAFYTTICAIPAVPPGEHGDALLKALIERNVMALKDWELLPG